MYESFFKLKKLPFKILPDPDFFFISESHGLAYSQLQQAVKGSKEYVAITGEHGLGKTTLINYFMNHIDENIKVGFINDVHAPVDQLTKLICQKFGLDVENKSSVGMLDFFHGFLLKQYEIEQRVILIIDEAQYLSPNAMEEIRVISDLEDEDLHLIQLILVGQPELKFMLKRKDIEDFAQRITIHCHLDMLSMAETEQYVRHRLNMAGAEDPNIFDEESIKTVYEYSNGIPRLINVICDTALIDGFANNVGHIDKAIIEEIVNGDKKGGNSFERVHKEDYPPVSLPEEAPVAEQTEDTPSGMVEMIGRLEGLASKIDNKLDMLLRRKDGRDRTLVELNKMLMDSLKRHGNTLKQFRSFKEKINQEKRLKAQQEQLSPSGDPAKQKIKNSSAKRLTAESSKK